MSQSSLNIANVARSLFRSAVNNALQALGSKNSGASAPTETYPFLDWFDTSNKKAKIRNSADSAWIVLGDTDQPNGLSRLRGPVLATGTATTVYADFGVPSTPDPNVIYAIEHAYANTYVNSSSPDASFYISLDGGTTSYQTCKNNNQNLDAGDIPSANYVGLWRYDPDLNKYQLLNPSTKGRSGTFASVASNGTGTFSGTYDIVGKLCFVRITGTFNSQTNASGAIISVSSITNLGTFNKANGTNLLPGYTTESTLARWLIAYSGGSTLSFIPQNSSNANISVTTLSGDSITIAGFIPLD